MVRRPTAGAGSPVELCRVCNRSRPTPGERRPATRRHEDTKMKCPPPGWWCLTASSERRPIVPRAGLVVCNPLCIQSAESRECTELHGVPILTVLISYLAAGLAPDSIARRPDLAQRSAEAGRGHGHRPERQGGHRSGRPGLREALVLARCIVHRAREPGRACRRSTSPARACGEMRGARNRASEGPYSLRLVCRERTP